MLYADRSEAGAKLAAKIAGRSYERPLVLALPRGGVPVASKVAAALTCALDTLVVRKVGAPFNPEFAVGALAPQGVFIIDEDSLATSGASLAAVEGIIAREKKELERRMSAYKSGSFSAGVVPSTVVIVDDGIATGMSAKAACLAARKKYPKAKIVIASPVCILDGIEQFRDHADEIVCLSEPTSMYAIGQAYGSFPQVSDEEVMKELAVAKRAH